MDWLSAFTALLLGFPITAGALLTGQEARLCAALGGVYAPALPPTDSCGENARWSNLWRRDKQ